MKQHPLKRSTVVVAVCAALFFVLLALWPTIATFLVQDALRSARSSGTRVAWKGVSASFLSARAELLEAWIPGPPIEVPLGAKRITVPGPALKIELREVTASVSPLSLLTFSPQLQLSGQLYGGTVTALVADTLSASPRADITIRNVTFEKHPQLSALGIEGGVVSGQAKQLAYSLKNHMVTSGEFLIELSRLALVERPELKMLLKIESLNVQQLTISGVISDATVSLKPVRVASSLGSAEADGIFSPGRHGRPLAFQLQARVTLAAESGDKLAEWLPLLTGGALTNSDKTFLVKSRTVPCSHAAEKVFKYSWGCTTTSFEPKPPTSTP